MYKHLAGLLLLFFLCADLCAAESSGVVNGILASGGLEISNKLPDLVTTYINKDGSKLQFIIGASIIISWKAWTLLGQPVIDSTAVIIPDFTQFKIYNIPDSVLQKVRFYDLKIKLALKQRTGSLIYWGQQGVGTISGDRGPLCIVLDPGVLSKPFIGTESAFKQLSETNAKQYWSYNVPGSPEWKKVFLRNGYLTGMANNEYLDSTKAKQIFTNTFMLNTFDEDGSYSSVNEVISLKVDFSPIREYLAKQDSQTSLSSEMAIANIEQTTADKAISQKRSQIDSQKQTNTVQAKSASVILLIDTSSSMSGSRLAAAKEGARKATDKILTTRGEMAVMGFSGSSAQPITSQIDFTQDANSVKSFINGLSANGSTPLSEALVAACQYMKLKSMAPTSNRLIVLLTDGEGSGDINASLAQLKKEGILVRTETIGLELGSNSNGVVQLQAISQASGGNFLGSVATDRLVTVLADSIEAMQLLDLVGTMGGASTSGNKTSTQTNDNNNTMSTIMSGW